MDRSALQFYEQLADCYHLIYADWERAIQRQASVLHRIIEERLGGSLLSVLDCSCGIGTQAIGLALLGYKVHGTDFSPKAIQRAQKEAQRLGAEVTFAVADLRALNNLVQGTFEVVISCDNSLPHMMTDNELLSVVRNMASKLKANGLLLVSTRDYDRLGKENPCWIPPGSWTALKGDGLFFRSGTGQATDTPIQLISLFSDRPRENGKRSTVQ